MPTSWITQTDNVYDQWTTLKPQLAASTAANETKYPYVYSCTQRKSVSGSVTYSTILLNVDGLVIDGANLIANSVTANAINASSLNASNSLTVGAMTSEAQSSILNFNLADSVQNLLAGTTSPTVSDTQWSPSLLTDNPLTWQRWGAATYSTLTKTTDGVKLQYLNNGSSGGICIPLVAENCITNGETVTVSFTYRGTITTTGSFWLLSKSGANAYNSDALTLTGDEEWHTVYKTFTAVRNANTCVALLIGYTSATGKYLEIKDSTMMLERGDTKKAIDAASQTATNYITADSTGIKIHNAGDSSNYQHLTPSEQAFYIGGTKVRSDTASASSFCEGNVQINTASGSGQTTAEISAFAPEYSTSSTDTKVTLKLGADAGNGLNETFNVIVQRNNTETPIASFRRYNVDYTYLAGSLNDGYWTRYKVNNSHVFVEFWYDSVSFDVITSAGVTASGSIPITLAPLDGDTFTKVGQQFAVKTTSNGIQAGCVWVATDGSVHAQCTAGAARTLITSFSYPIY